MKKFTEITIELNNLIGQEMDTKDLYEEVAMIFSDYGATDEYDNGYELIIEKSDNFTGATCIMTDEDNEDFNCIEIFKNDDQEITEVQIFGNKVA